MAYNLYQVQMAKAWAERIEKENAQQEKFWHQQTLKAGSQAASPSGHHNPISVGDLYVGDAQDVRSLAGSVPARSAAPTGYTSKTAYLRSRMEKLESDLTAERESRKKVEEDLQELRASMKH